MIQRYLPHYPSQLWPWAASSMAVEIDRIFVMWCIVLMFLVVPVFVFMTYCAVKYRAGRPADRSQRESRNMTIEMSWMIAPFLISLVFFFWAGDIYLRQQNPPPNAMVITALGRQWMWKFQHPDGPSEINDLHVPAGRPVRIDIRSQDVVHSLYIPALRQQEEAVPGRTTSMWFKADTPGAYRLFCSEFCGADHALMAGTLYVLSPADYQKWLKTAGGGQSIASTGKRLFEAYGCSGCHGPSGTVRAPDLAGLYGRVVPLQDGSTVVANDAYIHDSIMQPKRQIAAGYKPIMPSFAGAMSGSDVTALVAYIKSLRHGREQSP